MVLSKTASDSDESICSTFASSISSTEDSILKEYAYQIINDELMLDGNPGLNRASVVTTWMEPECNKLIIDSVNKNYVDMDEYPVTTELQNRCVNMIAHLFNAPLGDSEAAVGVGTVGPSEAIMLVCWEKFVRYFEVELKEVKLGEGYYVMDPAKVVELVDENTMCFGYPRLRARCIGLSLSRVWEHVPEFSCYHICYMLQNPWEKGSLLCNYNSIADFGEEVNLKDLDVQAKVCSWKGPP
ncbi:hypothetical protein MKW94_008747, partial [Papaver nudicaule]|nr:hypothetical protein [Papaver nudicaule]